MVELSIPNAAEEHFQKFSRQNDVIAFWRENLKINKWAHPPTASTRLLCALLHLHPCPSAHADSTKRSGRWYAAVGAPWMRWCGGDARRIGPWDGPVGGSDLEDQIASAASVRRSSGGGSGRRRRDTQLTPFNWTSIRTCLYNCWTYHLATALHAFSARIRG